MSAEIGAVLEEHHPVRSVNGVAGPLCGACGVGSVWPCWHVHQVATVQETGCGWVFTLAGTRSP
ncbi:hypothetical protein KCMC57_64500 (plasmid) [Kitasatospora sp. CMC57]|uniref:Uncharacterized protein n=1 Tax=Kitasatospora sp. CMC57 TaxID=3231513 RepID=A0AB33K3A9_9ACTN